MTIAAKRYLELQIDEKKSDSFARLEDEFYSSMKTSNGSRKTTTHRRLNRLNEIFFELIAKREFVSAVVVDVGVSSGITTLEWLDEFERRGYRVKMIATDRTMSSYLVRLSWFLDVLIEPNGHILQFGIMDFGIRAWLRVRDYLFGSVLYRNALRSFARSRFARLQLTFPIDPASVASRTGVLSGPHKLVCRELRARPNVVLMDDDLLAPNRPELIASADCIRLANVMQLSYFTEAELKTIAANIRQRCRGKDSIVIVCRSADDGLQASIMRLTDGGFEVEQRTGGGSEVERFFIAE